MYFDSFESALAMAGHGAYVWSAYAIVIVAITFIIVLPRRAERNILRELADDIRRQQGPGEQPEDNS